jgi:2-polyprenyl-3-methyl-5-hydroxy-6-metoxy-1,4-benzoquinol methylase
VVKEKSVAEFNADVDANDGYLYSTSNRLSCVMANRRISEAIIALADLNGKRVLDIGCGDGVYSIELLKAGAREVVGVDAAEKAIQCAQKKSEGLQGIRFQTADIYRLEQPEQRYDVAIVRGILHHLYEADKAIQVISRVADEIIVLEPNGFNPVLKILEKLSPYHVEHEEKSYAPTRLNRWFERCGGKVVASGYINLVPMFCPDYLARFLKRLEPLVEAIPGVRNVCCGQYLLKIKAA